MPSPTDRRKFGWAFAGVLAFGVAGVAGMARMIWAAWEKVLSGQGLETYHTVWLVEFNYVGFLVLVGAVIVGLLLAGGHWLHEWWQVRSLEKKYGPRESNT
jgi:hypothetical protein